MRDVKEVVVVLADKAESKEEQDVHGHEGYETPSYESQFCVFDPGALHDPLIDWADYINTEGNVELNINVLNPIA